MLPGYVFENLHTVEASVVEKPFFCFVFFYCFFVVVFFCFFFF